MTIFRGKPGKKPIPTFPEITAKPEITTKPSTAKVSNIKERRMDKRTLKQFTDYTKRARYILEDMESILKNTAEIRTIKMTQLDQDKIIIDIRKKLNDAEKVSKTCDNSLILAISEIDSELSRYPYMLQIPSYFSLMTDSKRIKQDFINNCKCLPKIKI